MASDDYEAPPEIETTLDCPICGSKLFMIYYTTTIPYEGRIVINTYVCHKCRYKNANVFSDHEQKKRRITFEISEPEDLNVTVYRSPTASILIPEISAEIFPGDNAEGTITTVEGILTTIEDRLDSFETDSANSDKMAEVRAFLSRLGECDFRITLIIEDDSGRSSIHSTKAVVSED